MKKRNVALATILTLSHFLFAGNGRVRLSKANQKLIRKMISQDDSALEKIFERKKVASEDLSSESQLEMIRETCFEITMHAAWSPNARGLIERNSIDWEVLNQTIWAEENKKPAVLKRNEEIEKNIDSLRQQINGLSEKRKKLIEAVLQGAIAKTVNAKLASHRFRLTKEDLRRVSLALGNIEKQNSLSDIILERVKLSNEPYFKFIFISQTRASLGKRVIEISGRWLFGDFKPLEAMGWRQWYLSGAEGTIIEGPDGEVAPFRSLPVVTLVCEMGKQDAMLELETRYKQNEDHTSAFVKQLQDLILSYGAVGKKDGAGVLRFFSNRGKGKQKFAQEASAENLKNEFRRFAGQVETW